MSQQRIGAALVIAGVLLVIALALVKTDLDRQGAFLCEIVAEDPMLSMEDCPAHESSSSWLLTFAFGIAFLFVGAGTYFLSLPAPDSGRSARKTSVEKLDGEERQIVALLESHEGSMYQSDLVRELDVSKVKVTRLLDRLELKGVVERKRRGMTNLVVLR